MFLICKGQSSVNERGNISPGTQTMSTFWQILREGTLAEETIWE